MLADGSLCGRSGEQLLADGNRGYDHGVNCRCAPMHIAGRLAEVRRRPYRMRITSGTACHGDDEKAHRSLDRAGG